MKLEYAGPRCDVTYHGVSFCSGRDDKYVYLDMLVNIIYALDTEHIEGKSHTIVLDTQKHKPKYLYDTIKKYCPNIDEEIEKHLNIRKEEIKDELYHAKKNRFLDAESKDAYIANIEIMQQYSLQRVYNKAVYYCGIYALADILEKDHIDEVDSPVVHHITHIFETVRGILQQRKVPIDMKIEMFMKDSQMHVKLKTINLGKAHTSQLS